jgi:hypothetical protein
MSIDVSEEYTSSIFRVEEYFKATNQHEERNKQTIRRCSPRKKFHAVTVVRASSLLEG